jgi:hypothetical protein
MTEQASNADHPRSDEVRGRHEEGYEAGFGDGGLGDRGGIGDQGTGGAARRENPDEEGDAPTAPAGSGTGGEGTTGGYADEARYGDLPRDR